MSASGGAGGSAVNTGPGVFLACVFGTLRGMAKCGTCEQEFDLSDARQEFATTEYGDETDYDRHFDGELCGECAISQANSWFNAGSAILMMNGDMDYDADHVEKYL
ncbi:hypothetical protein [Dactylosporangium sp. NPDC006015]|uniref:hypothetical protein n=1 Tax=Dactylosporangium sp. NPDC006015 TaxID=3154576 RepID=UPI0033AE80B0